jgi:hypothetical protein
MAKVRGTSFLGTLDFARTTYGEAGLKRILEGLPVETRSVLGEGGRAVLASSWYDARALSDLTRGVDRTFGQGDLALARTIGRHVAFTDVNRFFKWLFRLTGPKMIFPRAASVWHNYYDCGRYIIEQVDDGTATVRIEAWQGADEVLCKRLEGWIERACELTIGPNLNASIRETHHCAQDAASGADRFCRFEARWDV